MRNNGYGTLFRLNEHNRGIEHRTGGTHPGTKQRSMRGRLMLSMVSGVLSGLRLRQTADGENAQDE
jgi:hypothetical protein